MTKKYRTILLFGAPGAGKGTQGRILGSIPGFYHCACGDVFRNLRIDDPIGRAFVDFSSKGMLVPDEPTINLWRKNIGAAELHGSFLPDRDTLVLDGIPRNPGQVEMLRETLDVRALLYLTCADMGKMIERLQRRALRENRLDDANLETIRNRLATYEKETKKVLDCYHESLVHSIDSNQAPVFVLRDILDIVAKL
ncbi:MAG: nucleoside monophosphate kinase [Verrucomicrobia bacterium]|nr:nucleoside monophosphate kinase [Verrucomicrobiota bacterium]